jgi:hypothetical protein
VRRGRNGAGSEPAPRLLWSLTEEQASALRAAAESPAGCYVGISSWISRVAHELVVGGAAEYREIEQHSTDYKRGTLRWTDTYVVPTEHGLQLLNACSKQRT